jgi:hypothetical protein
MGRTLTPGHQLKYLHCLTPENLMRACELTLDRSRRLVRSLRTFPNTQDFVYLKRIDGTPVYNPYALRVVPFANIDPHDHFTLSAQGITYCHQGITDFTTLDQWTREVHLFVALRRLKAWHQFRIWKVWIHLRADCTAHLA